MISNGKNANVAKNQEKYEFPWKQMDRPESLMFIVAALVRAGNHLSICLSLFSLPLHV